MTRHLAAKKPLRVASYCFVQLLVLSLLQLLVLLDALEKSTTHLTIMTETASKGSLVSNLKQRLTIL